MKLFQFMCVVFGLCCLAGLVYLSVMEEAPAPAALVIPYTPPVAQ